MQRLKDFLLNRVVKIIVLILFVNVKSIYTQCSDATPLVELIESNHYKPTKKDSLFSSIVFTQFIEQLDPNKRLLTQSDLKEFKHFEGNLFQLLKTPCEFLEPISQRFEARKKEVKRYLASPTVDIDFTTNSYLLNTNNFNETYPKDEEELLAKWRLLLAYRTLSKWYDLHENDQSDLTEATYLPLSIDSLFLKEKRKTLCALEETLIEKKSYLKHIETLFFDAIASAYDPHTSYFTSSEKEQFTEQLSKEATGFGIAVTKNKENEFYIVAVQPGSPAWDTQQLNVDDKILAIKLVQKELDLTCISQRTLSKELGNKAVKQITLTIQKQDGKIEEVSIPRGKIEVEDNAIRGYLLSQNDKKVGYIAIPSFYTSWGGDGVDGCANDVAKEILKLKMNKIDGLILDLRYNTGGSFSEAINLAGIFIDFGPISMINTNENQPVVYKDLNRGMAYKGPLTVLVNGGSASASEVFAATMQDYNRALIVGTTTFGKSTGQSFHPLYLNHNYREEYGSVKITGSALYRLDGTSHQAVGVLPDIELKDGWEEYMRKESDYRRAIPNSTLDKVLKYNRLEELPITSLREKSAQRLASDTNHLARISHFNSINEFETDTIISLSLEGFKPYFQKQQEIKVLYGSDSAIKNSPITVKNHSYDNRLFSFSDEEEISNENTMNRITEDWQINEAYLIIIDLINQINSTK